MGQRIRGGGSVRRGDCFEPRSDQGAARQSGSGGSLWGCIGCMGSVGRPGVALIYVWLYILQQYAFKTHNADIFIVS